MHWRKKVALMISLALWAHVRFSIVEGAVEKRKKIVLSVRDGVVNEKMEFSC